MQEELSNQSDNISRTSSGSAQAAHEDYTSPTGKASSPGSSQATPRSLRPGTVPRLNLSPAVALHAAALEHPSDDEEELLAPRDVSPLAAVPSFDDLSGPEDSESELEGSSGHASDEEGVQDVQHGVQWHAAGKVALLQSCVTTLHKSFGRCLTLLVIGCSVQCCHASCWYNVFTAAWFQAMLHVCSMIVPMSACTYIVPSHCVIYDPGPCQSM